MKESYLPIFTNTSSNLTERWNMIQSFIKNWHKRTISNAEQLNKIADIEQKLGLVLPYSFRQYISLSTQLLDLDFTFQNGQKSNAFSEIFRDCFDVKLLENHAAISLMIQGEADFYWAIKISDLEMEDPKVYGYVLDYDCPSNDKFDFVGEAFPTITSFVLNHLFIYLQNVSDSGFTTSIKNLEIDVKNIETQFESHARFDKIEIFESENTIAYIRNEHDFGFHILNENKKHKIPPIIAELAKNKGWKYGNTI